MLFAGVERAIRKQIPDREIELVLEQHRPTEHQLDVSGDRIIGDDRTAGRRHVGALKDGHNSTWDYVRQLRRELPHEFPGVTFFFQPADMVSQVLNLGLPARDRRPGPGQKKYIELSESRGDWRRKIEHVPGAVDVRVQQVMDYPGAVLLAWTAIAPQQIGLSQRDVANELHDLASSERPDGTEFWLDPRTASVHRAGHDAAVQDVEHGRAGEHADQYARPSAAAVFGNLATAKRDQSPRRSSITTTSPGDRRVRERTTSAISAASPRHRQDRRCRRARRCPRGSQIVVRGQVASMRTSFTGPRRRDSVRDRARVHPDGRQFPALARSAGHHAGAPGALAGIVWMLYVTHTTFNVPSLMGAIMAMGVATSNSVLLVVFADDQRARAGRDRGGHRCRLHAAPPGLHDGARDDHRHDAHGARSRRRRRAECAARTRGDRRVARRHCLYAVRRALDSIPSCGPAPPMIDIEIPAVSTS